MPNPEMSLTEFEMVLPSVNVHKWPTKAQIAQAVFFAGALPWYLYAFWCVGYFGESAIPHFLWGK